MDWFYVVYGYSKHNEICFRLTACVCPSNFCWDACVGLHSAMLHENIMQSSNPDYLLVECEAERVAHDAARALHQSRQQCLSSMPLGTPTWTGTNGRNPTRFVFLCSL